MGFPVLIIGESGSGKTYSVKNFELYYQIKNQKIHTMVWRDNGSLILGGERNVTRLTLANYASETLFPSSAKKAWWNADGEGESLARD